MDAIDRKILSVLQEDASLSVAEIGTRVGLSSTPCWKRIQRLEADGVIQKRVAVIDQRNPAQDHAIGFQPLDAFPARRRRQSDPIADLGDRQRGVLLQDHQDLAVDGVEAAAIGFLNLNGSIGHEKIVP